MTRKAILLVWVVPCWLAVAGCHGLLCPCDNCGCCGGPCCGPAMATAGRTAAHPAARPLSPDPGSTRRRGCCEPCCRSECCGGPCGQCGCGCCGSCNGPCGDCCDPCADPLLRHCCFHPLRWIFGIFHGDGCCGGERLLRRAMLRRTTVRRLGSLLLRTQRQLERRRMQPLQQRLRLTAPIRTTAMPTSAEAMLRPQDTEATTATTATAMPTIAANSPAPWPEAITAAITAIRAMAMPTAVLVWVAMPRWPTIPAPLLPKGMTLP